MDPSLLEKNEKVLGEIYKNLPENDKKSFEDLYTKLIKFENLDTKLDMEDNTISINIKSVPLDSIRVDSYRLNKDIQVATNTNIFKVRDPNLIRNRCRDALAKQTIKSDISKIYMDYINPRLPFSKQTKPAYMRDHNRSSNPFNPEKDNKYNIKLGNVNIEILLKGAPLPEKYNF